MRQDGGRRPGVDCARPAHGARGRYPRARQPAGGRSDQRDAEGLSFDLAARLKEVGLDSLPPDSVPSEELLYRVEALSKTARDKGRWWVGSAEGESLRVHHRPCWSRTPAVHLPTGDGSYEDKLHAAAEATKKALEQEKVEYQSFSTFLGQLMEWIIKMVLFNVFTLSKGFAYLHRIVRVAEEEGGVFTAYTLRST